LAPLYRPYGPAKDPLDGFVGPPLVAIGSGDHGGLGTGPVGLDAGGVVFDRITIEPDKMPGQSCIRGLRIPVGTVVAMVAYGMSAAEILVDLPELEAEDVAQALRYAAAAVRERELSLRHPA
jgi:uncharacterized protein (DUF433 family)